MRPAIALPLLALLAAVPAVESPVAAASTTACPEVVAHRGFGAPENTVPAIVSGAAAGSGVVEVDVRWSKGNGTAEYPGWPVLMHDATVDRTTPGTGAVAASGLNALTSLAAQDYAPWDTDPRFTATEVPYAWEFLTAARNANARLLLDVQVVPDRFMATKLVEYLEMTSMRQRVIYMSSAAGVQAMRGWFPDLRYAVIEYPPAGRLFTGEHLLSLGAGAYAIPQDRLSLAAVTYFHSYGIEVYSWTSDSPAIDVPATWERVRSAGADFLITNRPDEAIIALACTVGS